MGKVRLLLALLLVLQLTAAGPSLAQPRRTNPATAPTTSLPPRAAQAPRRPLSLQQAIERAVGGNADLRRERIAIDVADGPAGSRPRGLRLPARAPMPTFSRRTTPPLSAQDLQGGSTNNLVLRPGLSRAARDRRRLQPGPPGPPPATPTAACSAAPWRGPGHRLHRLQQQRRPGLQPSAAARVRDRRSPWPTSAGSGCRRTRRCSTGRCAARQRPPRRDQHLLGAVLRHPGPGHPPLGGRAGPRAAARHQGPDRRGPAGARWTRPRSSGPSASACRRCCSPSRSCSSARWSCGACSAWPADAGMPIFAATDVPQAAGAPDVDAAGRDRPGGGEQPPAARLAPGHEAVRDRHPDRPLQPAPAAGLRGPGRRHAAASASWRDALSQAVGLRRHDLVGRA